MKPSFGLELVQSQKLALTPAVLQAITVLQMNAFELTDFIKQAVEENPLLEISEEQRQEVEPPTDLQSDSVIDEEWLAYFCDSLEPNIRPSVRSKSEVPLYELLCNKPSTLREHLSFQLRLLDLPPEDVALGEFIIGNIDDNGYLTCSTYEIACALSRNESEVERVLSIIQTFDPCGIGARDLRECLLIQIECKGLSKLCEEIVSNYLSDLANGRLRKIAQELRVSLNQVLSVRSEILHLNPKPGAAFSGGAVKFVIPDIVVRKIDDEIVIMMNDTAFPKVRWNSFYRTLLSSSGDDDAKKYLHEKLQKAKILLQNIEQRRSTVLKVMENVVNKQAGFFEEGDFSINPLTLKEVAADLGVHESTVSRAISNKYVDTPYGVYPCKMFFSPRIQSEGEDISQHSVKRIIQDIIDDEDKRNPLSDQDIVQHLERLGVKVARRTVAKYRGLLGIPSSAKRKAITNL